VRALKLENWVKLPAWNTDLRLDKEKNWWHGDPWPEDPVPPIEQSHIGSDRDWGKIQCRDKTPFDARVACPNRGSLRANWLGHLTVLRA